MIPPETPLVSFHWTLTAGRLRNTIAACTPLRFQLQAGLDSTKEIFPPFLLSILPEGAQVSRSSLHGRADCTDSISGQPVTKWIENIGVHESFWTTIDLPPVSLSCTSRMRVYTSIRAVTSVDSSISILVALLANAQFAAFIGHKLFVGASRLEDSLRWTRWWM